LDKGLVKLARVVILGELFDLKFEVKFLKEASTDKTLFLKNKSKFKPDGVYLIEKPKGVAIFNI
jgi:hypothetical protein